MMQAELQEVIVTKTKLTNQKALRVIIAMQRAIIFELSEGRQVKLEKFGIFKPVQTQSRSGRNPQTGEPLTIPARIRPVFSPSRLFQAYFNTNP